MSWFLDNRKLLALIAIFGIEVFLIEIHWYMVSIIVFLLVIYYIVNNIIVNQCLKPLEELSPKRKIRIIETIVIGDCCSKSFFNSRFDTSHTLFITSPGRSFKSSFLILQHVASRLEGRQVCIIVPPNDNSMVGIMDIPYLSQLTRLELKITDNPSKRRFFLFYNPLIIITYLIGVLSQPKESVCNDADLIEYCNRKGFNLLFYNK